MIQCTSPRILLPVVLENPSAWSAFLFVGFVLYPSGVQTVIGSQNFYTLRAIVDICSLLLLSLIPCVPVGIVVRIAFRSLLNTEDFCAISSMISVIPSNPHIRWGLPPSQVASRCRIYTPFRLKHLPNPVLSLLVRHREIHDELIGRQGDFSLRDANPLVCKFQMDLLFINPFLSNFATYREILDEKERKGFLSFAL